MIAPGSSAQTLLCKNSVVLFEFLGFVIIWIWK